MVVVMPARRRRDEAERLIRAFQSSGATSPSRAKSLQDIGLSEAGGFDQMAERGVFRNTSPGLWYMDTDALADYRADQRRRQMVGVVLALVLAVVAMALAWAARRG